MIKKEYSRERQEKEKQRERKKQRNENEKKNIKKRSGEKKEGNECMMYKMQIDNDITHANEFQTSSRCHKS